MERFPLPVLLAIALAAAACGRSSQNGASAGDDTTSRNLTRSTESLAAMAVASPLELDRTEVLEMPVPADAHRPAVTPRRAVPAAPVPQPDSKPQDPAVVEPSVVAVTDVPDSTPTLTPAPVVEVAAAAPVAVSSSSAAMALEPGETITVLTSPMPGPVASPKVDAPPPHRRGIVIGTGGSCPRGDRGHTDGGVIGILR